MKKKRWQPTRIIQGDFVILINRKGNKSKFLIFHQNSVLGVEERLKDFI